MKASLHRAILRSLAALLLPLAGSCGENSQVRPEPSTATSHGHAHGHSHVAPHGGTVVVLGNETYHVELVHDRAAGRLTLFVLDGHMENFIRLPVVSLELTCVAGGTERTLALGAVAQAATGETVGDTSQFAGQAEWLRTSEPITGKIRTITIRGTDFTDQPFTVTPPIPPN